MKKNCVDITEADDDHDFFGFLWQNLKKSNRAWVFHVYFVGLFISIDWWFDDNNRIFFSLDFNLINIFFSCKLILYQLLFHSLHFNQFDWKKFYGHFVVFCLCHSQIFTDSILYIHLIKSCVSLSIYTNEIFISWFWHFLSISPETIVWYHHHHHWIVDRGFIYRQYTITFSLTFWTI